MTHAELVEHARRWLLRRVMCNPVFCELVTYAGEVPDAIGWRGSSSFLVECKASRGDFFADRKKPWRQDGYAALGDYRYILCPEGMVQPDEVLPGWGLLWAKGKRTLVKRLSGTPDSISMRPDIGELRGYGFECASAFTACKRSELLIFNSVVRRIQLRGFDMSSIQQPLSDAGRNP